MSEPIGKKFLEILELYRIYECKIERALEEVFGYGPACLNMPWDDCKFDSYDSSMELLGCKPDFKPTDEELTACIALGFQRGWLCYGDGSETYFYWDCGLFRSHKTAEEKS